MEVRIIQGRSQEHTSLPELAANAEAFRTIMVITELPLYVRTQSI